MTRKRNDAARDLAEDGHDAPDTARRLSETARDLNYATLPADDFPGLEWPSDAYEVIGALAEVARRLTQATEQVGRFFEDPAGRDDLHADDGPNPAWWAGQAAGQLEAAGGGFTQAAQWLDRAHEAASHLGTRETGEGDAR